MNLSLKNSCKRITSFTSRRKMDIGHIFRHTHHIRSRRYLISTRSILSRSAGLSVFRYRRASMSLLAVARAGTNLVTNEDEKKTMRRVKIIGWMKTRGTKLRNERNMRGDKGRPGEWRHLAVKRSRKSVTCTYATLLSLVARVHHHSLTNHGSY